MTMRVKLELSGYADVEMSQEDYDALLAMLEEYADIDIGDIKGVDVSSAMETADLSVTDAMASNKRDGAK